MFGVLDETVAGVQLLNSILGRSTVHISVLHSSMWTCAANAVYLWCVNGYRRVWV